MQVFYDVVFINDKQKEQTVKFDSKEDAKTFIQEQVVKLKSRFNQVKNSFLIKTIWMDDDFSNQRTIKTEEYK